MRLASNLRGWLQGTAPELRQKRPTVQSDRVSEAKAPKDNVIRKWLQGTHPDLRGEQPSQRMAGTELPPVTKPRKQRSANERLMYGDKDARSMLAEEKLRIANEMVGGGYSRDQLVDMLNQGGASGGPFIDALNNDPRINAIIDLNNEGQFARPEFETQDFIGEGQFGRVSEFAPGYVIKQQAPLVEFHGYQKTEDGSDSPFGNLMGRGRIQDHRDVAEEVDQLNTLNKIGISPKVESFTVEPDGSTEVLMRDLRENYTPGEDFYNDLTNKAKAGTEAEAAEVFKQARLFNVKRAQQEAMAAGKGIELMDRHNGNVMAHKMMNRPLQIDPSGVRVSGADRDLAMADGATKGFRNAGLDQEADIYVGLVNEAYDRGDMTAVHDLAQQGVSRLMKIRNI